MAVAGHPNALEVHHITHVTLAAVGCAVRRQAPCKAVGGLDAAPDVGALGLVHGNIPQGAAVLRAEGGGLAVATANLRLTQ